MRGAATALRSGMSFANPSGSASAHAARYVASLLELLGDRDPLAVQRELVSRLGMVLDEMSLDQLIQPEAPGKWSVAMVVRHLAHTEIVYAYRYRVVLAQDDPAIPGFDQDLWAERLAKDPVSAHAAFAHLSALREWNLALLEGLGPKDMARSGRHAERGVETVDQLIRLGAAHDLVHRRQIDRIRKAVGA